MKFHCPSFSVLDRDFFFQMKFHYLHLTVFFTETSFSIHVLSCLICVASSTSYGTVNYGTLEMNRLDFVA